MIRFKQFLHSTGIRKGITLYHGSNSKLNSLKLPEKFGGLSRGADGHAVYLSTDIPEAGSYGKHLHTATSYHNPNKMINMDIDYRGQTEHVKKALDKLPSNCRSFLRRCPNVRTPVLQDSVENIGKHMGFENLTKHFIKHGVHGGFGQSDGMVYSLYSPEKHVKINSVQDSPNYKEKKKT